MNRQWLAKMLNHAAVPVAAFTLASGQISHKHGLYHAAHSNVTRNIDQNAQEKFETDEGYQPPRSPGFHELFGS
jgi:glucuronate isomerase